MIPSTIVKDVPLSNQTAVQHRASLRRELSDCGSEASTNTGAGSTGAENPVLRLLPGGRQKVPISYVTAASGVVLSEAMFDVVPWLAGSDAPIALEGRFGFAVTGGRFRLVATCEGGALTSFGRRTDWGTDGKECDASIEWEDEEALAAWVRRSESRRAISARS